MNLLQQRSGGSWEGGQKHFVEKGGIHLIGRFLEVFYKGKCPTIKVDEKK